MLLTRASCRSWILNFLFILFVCELKTFVVGSKLVWENWAQSYTSEYDVLHTPRTELEIVEIVQNAFQNGERVKVAGSGHSMNAVAAPQNHLIDLDLYNATVSIENDEVTFQAGIRLFDAVERLDALGLAFPNLGDILTQSLAGAISTNTAGSGPLNRGISDAVIAVRLITGNGSVVEANEVQNRNIFKAAQIGVGVIGIFSTITIKAVPEFRLRREVRILSANETIPLLMDMFEEQMRGTYAWWMLGPMDAMVVQRWSHTMDPISPNGGCRAVEGDCVDKSYIVQTANEAEIMKFVQPKRALMLEFFMDPAETLSFLYEWHYLIDEGVLAQYKGQVNVIPQFRWCSSDDMWLSPSYERISFKPDYWIDNIQSDNEEAFLAYLREYSILALKHGALPHWGKNVDDSIYTPEVLRSLWPLFDEFLRTRLLIDPTGVFLNEFTEKIFL